MFVKFIHLSPLYQSFSSLVAFLLLVIQCCFRLFVRLPHKQRLHVCMYCFSSSSISFLIYHTQYPAKFLGTSSIHSLGTMQPRSRFRYQPHPLIMYQLIQTFRYQPSTMFRYQSSSHFKSSTPLFVGKDQAVFKYQPFSIQVLTNPHFRYHPSPLFSPVITLHPSGSPFESTLWVLVHPFFAISDLHSTVCIPSPFLPSQSAVFLLQPNPYNIFTTSEHPLPELTPHNFRAFLIIPIHYSSFQYTHCYDPQPHTYQPPFSAIPVYSLPLQYTHCCGPSHQSNLLVEI